MTALSLHVGLNAVDASKYDGWDGKLNACEADAFLMRDICMSQGFKADILTTKDALANTVRWKIHQAARALTAGDTFVLSFSCHGGQVDDPWNKYGQIDTIVMYDREIISHELYEAWNWFQPGVRVAMFSDSCHSGTVSRERIKHRAMPHHIQAAVHNKPGFAAYLKAATVAIPEPPKAGVILISGCQDNQTSADGDVNGLFTQTMNEVWYLGNFKGNYRQFRDAIVKRMPPEQTPNYFEVGGVTSLFRESTPFSK